MNGYEIHNGSLYDYTAGVACGVLVTEKVMKKLARAQATHLEEVKKILSDSSDDVFPSMWTLHYPGGKQTMVRYIDKSKTVAYAIKHAVIARKPEHVPLCFIASSMEEAEKMANSRHSETKSTEIV
jgi:hypothetical protein